MFLYLQSPLTFGQVNVYCALFIVRIKINNNNTSRGRVTTCACSRVDAMGRYIRWNRTHIGQIDWASLTVLSLNSEHNNYLQ